MKHKKEFKEAISSLPATEKDKLILRLLRHDMVLTNRLYFELVDTQTVDERRANIEKRVKERAVQMSEHFYSVGYLMMDMRYLSGEITDHVKTTKDKFGESSLNLLMLNEVLRHNNTNITMATLGKSYKMCLYVIARAFKILISIRSLHEDYHIDFESGLMKLGKLISDNHYLMKTAINNGFDVNWLLNADIPENIKEIHKKVRSEGFLK